MTELSSVPAKARVTVWSSDGPAKAYDAPKTRALLDRARPQVITLHGDALSLASDRGLSLTERVRRDHPASEVWWGVQGDGYGPDPSRQWTLCARAAASLGVPVVEWNCETAWPKRPAGTARKALLAAKEAAPRVVFGHTSFDGPVSIPVGKTLLGKTKRWGYGESYPWREFLGDGSPVEWSAWQVYGAYSIFDEVLRKLRMVRADRAALLTRFDRHVSSVAIARHKGLLGAGLARYIYLQSHDSDTSGLVTLAQTAPVAAFWCAPGGLDDDGARAVHAVAELHRRGQTVRAFQASAGLAADSICGPLTLRQLGVA